MQVFLSYAGEDAFEASLLQYAVGTLLADLPAKVWTYQRDQLRDQQTIATNIKSQIHQSRAMIFRQPQSNWGPRNGWNRPMLTPSEYLLFVLLNHVIYPELREREKGVPPLLLQSQCNAATAWRDVVQELRLRLMNSPFPSNKAP